MTPAVGKHMMTDTACIYDVLDALNAAILSADPVKRSELYASLNAWGRDNPDDACWSFGMRSPWLLRALMIEIDAACMPANERTPKPTLRVVT
jgi:hypothetical protein